MTKRRDLLASLGVTALGASLPGLGRAQGAPWPGAKPITYLVPFFPGSTADMIARIVAQKVGESLRQSILVDNRTGMGGNIGVAAGAKAAPDGYTLVSGTSGTHATNVSLYKNLPYDPVKDFEPVSLIGSQTSILTVGTALGVNSVEELVALLKRDEKTRNYGSAGAGTSPHLAGVLFSELVNIPLTHVAYKGQSGMTDVVSGQLTFKFDQLPSTLPLVQAGKIKALAVSSSERMPQLPQVPTLAEAGVKGFDIESWHAVYVPKGTPKAIVERLGAEINKALNAPDVRAKLADLGVKVTGGTPTQLADLMAREIPRWAEIIKKSGAKLD